MKKFLLLVLAAFFSFVGTELIVAKVIGYPTYGVEAKMDGIRGLDRLVNIFKPHSSYWTVEGGNKTYRRNNIGLPGMDIKIADKPQFIFVLGSSYIEAYQLPPEKIASSVLQEGVRLHKSTDQVLNLGYSEHDPYDLFWRASFYEKMYPPSSVLLVLDRTYDERILRQAHPLDFDPTAKVPSRSHSRKMELAVFLMNHSAFLNLLSNLVLRNVGDNDNAGRESSREMPNEGLFSDLTAILMNFKSKYKERFSLASIAGNDLWDARLREFCKTHQIRFISRNLLVPEYRLNEKGHLNEEGNRILGEMLYEAIKPSGQK